MQEFRNEMTGDEKRIISHAMSGELLRQKMDNLRDEMLESGYLETSRRKIGRNEPCPCGSGEKFKRCHLGKV